LFEPGTNGLELPVIIKSCVPRINLKCFNHTIDVNPQFADGYNARGYVYYKMAAKPTVKKPLPIMIQQKSWAAAVTINRLLNIAPMR
jgi:hypothetical protein